MRRNLFEITDSEKTRILEMHYKASGKTLLKEQGETAPVTPPTGTQHGAQVDWSEGGKKTWENADIKKIIQFIRNQVSPFSF